MSLSLIGVLMFYRSDHRMTDICTGIVRRKEFYSADRQLRQYDDPQWSEVGQPRSN
jgi:hypothetical protein